MAAARVLTGLAVVLVCVALILPNAFSRLTVPAGWLRLPVEAIVGVALLLVLPVRARRVVAALLGVVLGALTVVKLIDMGFLKSLGRPFDPVLDWVLFDDAYSFLIDSVGRAGAIGAAVGAVLLAVVVLVLLTLAVLRSTTLVVRHRRAAFSAVAVLAVVWLSLATFGVTLDRRIPVAARSTSTYAYDRVLQVRAAMQDRDTFAAQAAADAFRDTPGDKLLTALRGKDVIVAFVESYGRSAVEAPAFAEQIGGVLNTGTRRLAEAGFTARSGYLTSPTAGGGSWLAHSTFLSGLWINNQQRYRTLTASDRMTLPSAFARADWRTIGVQPGNTRAWPEGEFYGYETVYDSRNLGYRGPEFSWSNMPDQYTLSAFDRLEYRKPQRGPLMVDITLTSSHTPWAPIPRTVDWEDIGDGSIYAGMAKEGKRPKAVWKDPVQLRTEYRRSIGYSINSLVSYVENFGNDNLVMIMLGDHEPSPIVVGENAGRDVPISIVAHDPAVLERISSWGWNEGLKPAPQAPVWPMNQFRDRFLTAYSN